MKEMNFEQAMDRLNEIVSLLENNEIPLEEAIKLFEEGLKLSQYCDQQLKSFEQKVDTLMKDYDQNI